jgi:hypothetical protein
MSDWLWPILTVLGLLVGVLGGGGWIATRGKRKKAKQEALAPRPTPERRPRVAPTPVETEEADNAAKTTDKRVEELEDRAVAVADSDPDPVAPDPGVADWLRGRRDGTGND